MLLECTFLILAASATAVYPVCEFSSEELDIYEAAIRYNLVTDEQQYRERCAALKHDAEHLEDADERESARLMFDLSCTTDYSSELWVSINGCGPPPKFLSRFERQHATLHLASDPRPEYTCRLGVGPISPVADNRVRLGLSVVCGSLGGAGWVYLLQGGGGLWLVVEEKRAWIS